MSSGAYQTAKSIQSLESRLGSSRVKKARKVKQKTTWRQRLRNWLNKDIDELDVYIPQDQETAHLSSEGMRFNVHWASGGYVVETKQYDKKNDQVNNHLYVITKDKDIGHEIGKIITMESLR